MMRHHAAASCISRGSGPTTPYFFAGGLANFLRERSTVERNAKMLGRIQFYKHMGGGRVGVWGESGRGCGTIFWWERYD